MTRRELGAGVSVMWVIFLIVLLLACGAYIYFVQSEITGWERQVASAQSERDEAAGFLEDARRETADLSRLVGFNAAGSNSNTATIQTAIDEARARFPDDVLSGDKTLQTVIERLGAVADRYDQERQAADGQFQTELSQRQAAESAKDDIQSSMQSALDSVNSDLRDQRERSASAESQADDRYGQLQEELDQKDTNMREQSSSFEQQVAEIAAERDKMTARTVSLADKVKIIGSEDSPWAEDGSVIDAGSGVAYIDIGSKHLLRNGVRFEVYDYDKGGNRYSKGQVEVRQLENNHSVARIVTQVSDLDPIAAGDKVSNPHFNRDRTKNFALIGNFPGYGKTFLTQRLESLGATVSKSINSDVDAVILGSKGVEEDATELTDLPEYGLARELNVQVMRLADIEAFLRP